MGDKTIDYTYNGDGLRTSKTVNDVTTTHIWDGGQIVLELDGAGSVTGKYVRGINLLYAEDGTGANRKWYLFNGHGDVVQLTGTDGNVTKTYDYDAFGNEKNPDANDTNVFRYCGEYFDLSSGTYYLRARYYDPQIGRFISEDSVWGKDKDPLSLNLYTYVNNNPIMYIDPTGHSATAVWTGSAWVLCAVDGPLPVGEAVYVVGIGVCFVADNAQTIANLAPPVIDAVSKTFDSAGNLISEAADVVKDKIGDGISYAKDKANDAKNWVKNKLGGGSSNGDPGKDPNNIKRAMDNIRVMKDTKIGQYKVSMDLERGGSGLTNIHLKIGDTKYFFNSEKGMFLDSLGNRVPNALRGNQQIVDALQKAQKLIEGGF